MSFAFAFALGIALLVAAPYLAHRLRRARAEEHPFAPVRLVPPTPPKARRRARLDDRALFGVRAASVVALALLGASPLARCSKLALSRGGASVAIALVIDDSMSMRAAGSGAGMTARSRFERARKGALDIVASLREGDAVAIVMAGAPARVALAATTDVSAARVAVEALTESDRATDLDGAVAMAQTLIADLPQIDRRVVVLSDLADGKAEAGPLGEGAKLPMWVAMPDLQGEADDCGLLAADRTTNRVRVRFACTSLQASSGRNVQLKDGNQVLASAQLPSAAAGEVVLTATGDETRELVVELTGADAIASDDRVPVVVEAGPAAIAAIGESAEEAVATGGAPIVEQALAALHLDLAVRPLPQLPDRREDMAPFAALLIDDPPGLTPEQRHALAAFVDGGGMVLIALGPRSAVAPLGANFEPLLGQAVTWGPSPASGIDAASGATLLGEAAASLTDLAPKGRITLAEQDASSLDPLLKWSDGALLVGRRVRRRGEAWIVTLPLSLDASDLPLRPGFLALLDDFVAEARHRSAPRRGDVGVAWTLPGARQIEAEGPAGKLEVGRDDGALRLVPALAGAYRLTVDGSRELRVAAPVAREIDLRPRPVASGAASTSMGGGTATVDVSWVVALALLALTLAELVMRAVTAARMRQGEQQPS